MTTAIVVVGLAFLTFCCGYLACLSVKMRLLVALSHRFNALVNHFDELTAALEQAEERCPDGAATMIPSLDVRALISEMRRTLVSDRDIKSIIRPQKEVSHE